ncbi:MAG: hypothetical protein COV43_05335 [Deltaproteobacteria bacterium CG11_big_fil_rev_8_21_14_0_20_42_23]|nr:MAG: hypothetical protein COV43_05335 [Deltaproteobacteria bacterium CG11_big_fil_rev_8_21_14_0_20_42_23]PJC64015.1 MAG: hypothetical protein CO021_06310 [Deltaproteobacteria bacterium CG_4_9_14_0_2_um_filter_42_21]
MAGLEAINTQQIRAQSSARAMTTKSDGGEAFLGILEALGPVTAESAAQAGAGVNSQTVLSSAFSGVSASRHQLGGVPSYSSATGSGTYVGGGVSSTRFNPSVRAASYDGSGPGDLNAGSADTLADRAALLDQMNQSNTELLQLQAQIQSTLQSFNIKSNILSADHRARMSMIEKFTARG